MQRLLSAGPMFLSDRARRCGIVEDAPDLLLRVSGRLGFDLENGRCQIVRRA